MSDIVVLDSEPIVRSVVTAILKRAGHSVHPTGTFDEAITQVRERLPDLVVTNVFLSDISGHDAMLRLKNDFPGLRVLMVSGLPDEKLIKEWVEQPGFDVFPKPFTPDDLRRKVDEMLADRA